MNRPETRSFNCPWRDESAERSAECGLLRELTGITQRDRCAVDDDACASCVKWYTPGPDHLNPVVASLLYTLSSEVVEMGGIPGCSVQRAQQLRNMALHHIPNDYDWIPIAEQTDLQQNTTIPDIAQLIPRPRRRYGEKVSKWALAVTTAPRKQLTLDRCLRSILAAGWPNPRIIADGDVSISERWNNLPITRHAPQIGAWPSYYLTMIELMMRMPDADAYLIVQDDVVFFEHPLTRSYLESVLWIDQRPGIVSLYCSRAYSQECRGWHRLDQNLVWGGQALVFSRSALIQLVSDLEVVRHRFSEGGLANIDGVIGKWAFETDTPVYVCSPSLAQHVGHVSALWSHAKAFDFRSAAEFAGNCQRVCD